MAGVVTRVNVLSLPGAADVRTQFPTCTAEGFGYETFLVMVVDAE
jgi:hypothetical protein